MAEYDLPISALLQRASNTMQTIRNLRVSAGDDFTVTVTVYQSEDATVPQPLIGNAWLNVFDVEGTYGYNAWGWERWSSFAWDYGSLGWGRYIPAFPIYQVQGTVGGSAGTIQFAVTPVITQLWRGRYAFTVQLADNGAGALIVRGIIDVEPGIVFPGALPTPFILDTSTLDGPADLGP